MNEDLAYRVRRRAYELWEEAGKPDGKDMYFWKRAKEEISGTTDDENASKHTPTDSFPHRED